MSKMFYMGVSVAFEERRAWIQLAVTIVGYTVYLTVILSQAGEFPLARGQYLGPMVITIAAAVVATMIVEIVVSIRVPREDRRKDQRDQEITHFGERIAHPFVVIGALAAMVLALFEVDFFWITNAVYLAFVLSSTLGCLGRIAAYRHGFQS